MLIRIHYKSGTHIDVVCADFEINSVNDQLLSIQIKFDADHQIRPIHLGIESIESVWKLPDPIAIDPAAPIVLLSTIPRKKAQTP
jgi:hypothetical protein